MHGLDAGFASFAALGEALERLQDVEEAAVGHPASADRDSLLELAVEREVEFRATESDRDGRAGHHREVEFPRPVVHLFGLLPVVGEMFVVEDGTERRECLKTLTTWSMKR